MNAAKSTYDAQSHIDAVWDTWHRHGREAAADILVMYNGATINEARQAAKLLQKKMPNICDSILDTANWMRCADGVCPEGSLLSE